MPESDFLVQVMEGEPKHVCIWQIMKRSGAVGDRPMHPTIADFGFGADVFDGGCAAWVGFGYTYRAQVRHVAVRCEGPQRPQKNTGEQCACSLAFA